MVFKKSALKDAGFKYGESGLVVQALKVLGREHLDRTVIEGLSQRLEPKACGRIFWDIRSVSGWLYETIKRICREGN